MRAGLLKWAAMGAIAGGWRRRRTFKGAVVLITGGSRGLGLLLAREFGRRGAKLALCARDRQELARAEADLRSRGYEVLALPADVSQHDSAQLFVEQTVRHYGRLDVAVCNAGIIQVGPAQAMQLKDFRDAMGSIFWGSWYIADAAIPHLRESPRPRLVNITSIGGAVAVPHLLPYAAAKFATVGYSTGLAAEVAREGIRVVTVLPGLMRTGSFVNALVKGRREQETAWFSLGASLPVLSMNGERAARRIVAACQRGTPFVTLGLPAKVLRLTNALFPGLMIRAFALVNEALPHPLEVAEGPASPAGEHRTGVARSPWVILGDRAAAQNNEEHVPAPEQLH